MDHVSLDLDLVLFLYFLLCMEIDPYCFFNSIFYKGIKLRTYVDVTEYFDLINGIYIYAYRQLHINKTSYLAYKLVCSLLATELRVHLVCVLSLHVCLATYSTRMHLVCGIPLHKCVYITSLSSTRQHVTGKICVEYWNQHTCAFVKLNLSCTV